MCTHTKYACRKSLLLETKSFARKRAAVFVWEINTSAADTTYALLRRRIYTKGVMYVMRMTDRCPGKWVLIRSRKSENPFFLSSLCSRFFFFFFALLVLITVCGVADAKISFWLLCRAFRIHGFHSLREAAGLQTFKFSRLYCKRRAHIHNWICFCAFSPSAAVVRSVHNGGTVRKRTHGRSASDLKLGELVCSEPLSDTPSIVNVTATRI